MSLELCPHDESTLVIKQLRIDQCNYYQRVQLMFLADILEIKRLLTKSTTFHN